MDTDPLGQVGLEPRQALVSAAAKSLLGERREPALHEVEPRGVGRREVEVGAGTLEALTPLPHPGRIRTHRGTTARSRAGLDLRSSSTGSYGLGAKVTKCGGLARAAHTAIHAGPPKSPLQARHRHRVTSPSPVSGASPLDGLSKQPYKRPSLSRVAKGGGRLRNRGHRSGAAPKGSVPTASRGAGDTSFAREHTAATLVVRARQRDSGNRPNRNILETKQMRAPISLVLLLGIAMVPSLAFGNPGYGGSSGYGGIGGYPSTPTNVDATPGATGGNGERGAGQSGAGGGGNGAAGGAEGDNAIVTTGDNQDAEAWGDDGQDPLDDGINGAPATSPTAGGGGGGGGGWGWGWRVRKGDLRE